MSEERAPTATADDGDDEFEIPESEAQDEDEGEGSAETGAPDAGGGAVEDGDGDDAGGSGGGRSDEREAPPEAARSVTRRGQSTSDRFKELSERTRRAEEQAQLFQRQLADLVNTRQQAEAEHRRQQEEQQLQFLTPEQRIDYRARQIEQRGEERLRAIQISMWDQGDRDKYDRVLESSPKLSRFNSRVEALRREYPTVSRIDLLDKAIGQAMREGEGRARTRAATSRQNSERLQSTNPPSSRSSVAGEQRRQGSASLEERLRGQII